MYVGRTQALGSNGSPPAIYPSHEIAKGFWFAIGAGGAALIGGILTALFWHVAGPRTRRQLTGRSK